MNSPPVLPQWLIEASDQMSRTYIPAIRIPGRTGLVGVSVLGIVAAAYVEGYQAAQRAQAPVSRRKPAALRRAARHVCA